jgi:transcription elongation factor Elf1
MLTFEEIKADVEEAQRAMRSELADAYPCEECGGECYIDIGIGDQDDERDCSTCGGTGAWEFAEEARKVDAYLASSRMTVSTRTEIDLRDCLIRALAGTETLDDYRGPEVFESPVLDPLQTKEVDQLVEGIADDMKARAAADCREHRENLYAYAFGALAQAFRQFLIDTLRTDKSINEAIREARIASQAVSGNGGAAS